MENYETENTLANEIEASLVATLDAKRETAGALSRAHAALQEAQNAFQGAWKEAIKAGWNETELAAAGITPPAQKPARRKRPARKNTPAQDSQS
ncbi:MAG: hypothetical protein IKZ87_08485 [Actinomycetaceae bacterium]|nr:hypothetical protein [Actinomycetaceae bacterium]